MQKTDNWRWSRDKGWLKEVAYLHVDYSKGCFGVNPLAEVPKGIIALEMSLDFAEMIADHLEEKGFKEHAKILRDWIERTPKAEEEPPPSITTSTNTPDSSD